MKENKDLIARKKQNKIWIERRGRMNSWIEKKRIKYLHRIETEDRIYGLKEREEKSWI